MRRVDARKRRQRASARAAIAEACERRFDLLVRDLDQYERRLAGLETAMLAVAARLGLPF